MFVRILSSFTLKMNPWACPVIVYDNGRSGFLGEHSCMDGTPTLRMNEFILASLASGSLDLGAPRTTETGSGLPPPKELQFVLDDKSKANIQASEARFDELVGAHDLHVCFLAYCVPSPSSELFLV
jgi:carnitine O-acetyltransferase